MHHNGAVRKEVWQAEGGGDAGCQVLGLWQQLADGLGIMMPTLGRLPTYLSACTKSPRLQSALHRSDPVR